MARDTTPIEEFRRVTATTMRAVSRKEVNVSFVPDGGSLGDIQLPGEPVPTPTTPTVPTTPTTPTPRRAAPAASALRRGARPCG